MNCTNFDLYVIGLFCLLVSQLVGQNGLLNARKENDLLNPEKICKVHRGTKVILGAFN